MTVSDKSAEQGLPRQTGEKDSTDLLIKMITECTDENKHTILASVARTPDKKKLLKTLLKKEGNLLGWIRKKIHKFLSEAGQDMATALLEILREGDKEILNSALILAYDLHSGAFIPVITHLLSSDDFWVRSMAVDILGKIGGEDAVDPLVEKLQDEELKWSVISALGQIRSVKALPVVGRLIADSSPVVRLEVINFLEKYGETRLLNILKQVFMKDPDSQVRERALEAFRHVSEKNKIPVDEEEIRKTFPYRSLSDKACDQLLTGVRRRGASDLLIVPGAPPMCRVQGKLFRLSDEILAPNRTRELLEQTLDEFTHPIFEKDMQVDFCYRIEGVGRYRANVFNERRGMAGAFRVIPNEIPSFTDIGLPGALSSVTNHHQGLILVTGRSGSGKTTTLAALVNLINETKRLHIITLEDPIEYIHAMKLSLINQREVRRHTVSFAQALKASLREDPDVIVVGEMRDIETMRLAVMAAETGHLVLATLHTPTAVKAVDRIIDSFPAREQKQIRITLADSIKVVIGQSLLPGADGKAQIACYEVMMATPAISNLIREEKTTQIPAIMQIARKAGMRSFDHAMLDLVTQRRIKPETAFERAQDKELFRNLVSKEFLDQFYST